jgi:hypothetical protein
MARGPRNVLFARTDVIPSWRMTIIDHIRHTSSLLSIEPPSARMIRIGSRGDILGSVASCPGLRVQYWKLWSGDDW